jgi:hypothetical protein
MGFAEYLEVLGGIAALLGLQGFWITRRLARVEAAVDRMRERVAKLEG